MYYFMMMDCSKNLQTGLKNGNMARLIHEISIIDSWSGKIEDGTHFSYENQGELRLHVLLTFLMLGLCGLTVKTYMDYYKEEDKLCSPHPILLISLGI